MKTSGQLLTEEQSAELAGVSIDTIKRFCQFGLLQSIEQDGSPFISEDEILSLFHVRRPSDRERAPTAPTGDIKAEQKNTSDSLNGDEPSRSQRPDFELRVLSGGIASGGERQSTMVDRRPSSADTPIQEGTTSSHPPRELRPVASAPSLHSPRENSTTSALVNEQLAVVDTPPGTVEYQTVRELLDANRILRESVQNLREERDWLRERIEKLEAFSQREQMLLLSNSETIRTLISQKETKREGFLSRLALPLLRPFRK